MKLDRFKLFDTERTNGKKFGVMALVGLILIPAMLAASFQWTAADAANNLDRVQAAVVNLDKPVTIDDQYTPLGRLMVMRLTDQKDNPVNIGWTLTDAADAQDGLEDGRFAAVVTIPEDFSANATSVSLQKPNKVVPATIDVQTSQSAGVVDPSIGQALSGSITQSLNAELTAQYLKNIFLELGPAKKKFGKAVWGSGQLADGLTQAYDGSHELVDGLAKLAWGTDKVADGNEQLADGLGQAYEQVKPLPAATQQLADGSNMLSDGLHVLDDNVAAYSGQITQVIDLGQEISAKTGPQQKQLESLGASLGALDSQLDASVQACQAPEVRGTPACENLLSLDSQIGAVRQGLGIDLNTAALNQLLKQLKTLDQTADEVGGLVKGVRQLSQGADKLAWGMGKLNAKTPELVAGLQKAAWGSRQLADGSRQVADGAALAADKVQALPEGLGQLRDGASKLHNGLAKADSKIPDWNNAQSAKIVEGLAQPVRPVAPELPNTDLAAGYFTALALAIAALVVFMLIRAVPEHAVSSSQNSFALTMKSYLPAVAIAAMQAAVVALALEVSLHLPVLKLLAFTGVVFIAAAVMSAVSQALVAALGGAGRFVGLMAIAISAPTALISTAPEALDFIVGLTPIAPTIDALRGVIVGGENITPNLLALALWGAIALVVTTASITKERQVSARALAARYA